MSFWKTYEIAWTVLNYRIIDDTIVEPQFKLAEITNINFQIIYLKLQGGSDRWIAIEYSTIFVCKEFGEVPFDAAPEKATFHWFQILVYWSSIGTIYINLSYHLPKQQKNLSEKKFNHGKELPKMGSVFSKKQDPLIC